MARRVRRLITGRSGIAGKIAAGLGAALGYMAFSGKDDNYNTIEGLAHGGEGQKKRKELTEFGSGWRGIVNIPRSLQTLFKFKGQHRTKGFNTITKRDAWRKGYAAKISEEIPQPFQAEAMKDLNLMHAEMGLAPESVILINQFEIGRYAKQQGVSHMAALKGTIKHERFHQAVVKLGYRDAVSQFGQLVPERAQKEYFKHYLESYGAKRAESMKAEEYFAQSFSSGYGKETLKRKENILMYSKGWAQVGVKPHYVQGGLEKIKVHEELSVLMRDIKKEMSRPTVNPAKRAEYARIMSVRQNEAAKKASILALKGGQGHQIPANRSTF